MKMEMTKTELARKVAKALRHDPDSLDLEMDDKGWVSFDDLLEGFERYSPYHLTRNEIKVAVIDNNRGRFDIKEKEGLLRAKIGHTTDKVQYKVVEPKEDIYHRMESESAYNSINKYGLRPARRKYTQLFSFGGALKDGKKRGIKNSIMISIKAREAYHEGTVFYERDGKIFIEEVDPIHLDVHRDDED